MQHTVRHTIETDVDSCWRLFLDSEFNHAMARHFGTVFEVLEERTDASGVLYRRTEHRLAEQVELPPLATKMFGDRLPALAKKLFGDGAGTEIASFDPVARKCSAQYAPKIGADKFRVNTEVWVEPLGVRRCERVLVTKNVVKIWGLGRAIEGFIEKQQRDAQAKIVDFFNGWIRDKGL